MVVGEEVTDWLGDTGVLLVSCCDVLAGTMLAKRVACVVTVSLLMEYVDDRFVETDDDWPAKDDTNPLVEFENKVDVCGVARESDGDAENADID